MLLRNKSYSTTNVTYKNKISPNLATSARRRASIRAYYLLGRIFGCRLYLCTRAVRYVHDRTHFSSPVWALLPV